MQRRAAAAYVVFFLVLAAGAYAMIATTEAPEVALEQPYDEYGSGDTLSVDGRTYTVSELTAEKASGGGGHGGGGGGIERSATFQWTNESARFSEEWTAGDTTLENASIVSEGGTVTVEFPEPESRDLTFSSDVNSTRPAASPDSVHVEFTNGTTDEFVVADGAVVTEASLGEDNSTITVRFHPPEVRTYSVLIPDDSTVLLRQQPTEETISRDSGEFVLVDRNGDGTEEAIPIEEYEPLDRVEITPDDDFQYRGNATDLSIDNDTATLAWTSPTVESVTAGDRGNVTLNGQDYFAFFPDNNTVYLKPSGEIDGYRASVQAADRYHSRENGFWGVTILSMMAATLLLGLAFLPRKEV